MGRISPHNPLQREQGGTRARWGNSLFEDAAEFGYGIAISYIQRRNKLVDLVQQALEESISQALKDALSTWLDGRNDAEASKTAAKLVKDLLSKESDSPTVGELKEMSDLLVKKSVWAFGGDGWAYDIGFGGGRSCLGLRGGYEYSRAGHRSLFQHRRSGLQGHAIRGRGQILRHRGKRSGKRTWAKSP